MRNFFLTALMVYALPFAAQAAEITGGEVVGDKVKLEVKYTGVVTGFTLGKRSCQGEVCAIKLVAEVASQSAEETQGWFEIPLQTFEGMSQVTLHGDKKTAYSFVVPL